MQTGKDSVEKCEATKGWECLTLSPQKLTGSDLYMCTIYYNVELEDPVLLFE